MANLAGRLLAYFTAWGIYGRNFQPTDIPVGKVTHINYAFANIVNGECAIGDSYADVEKSYDGDTWDQPIKGNFNQINNVLKKKQPGLQTLISVGGWTWSTYFSDVAADAASRDRFVTSCVSYMTKYGFNGIDLDWEYPVLGGLPTNHYRPDDGSNYLLLVQRFRQALTELTEKTNANYLLTIAAPAGEDKFKYLDLKRMSDYLDWFNIMTYDYNGCWSNYTSHMTNLYYNPADPQAIDRGYNGNASVQAFLAAGVPASKINLGVAFYGRGFGQVKGSGSDWMFKPFADCPQGTWDDWQSGKTGVFDYKDIANKAGAGWESYWDDVAKAPYIHSGDIVIGYDNAKSIQIKSDYLKANRLGGLFSWSFDGDRQGELLNAMYAGLS